jgi:DNA-binding transcriptional LysR family regulator
VALARVQLIARAAEDCRVSLRALSLGIRRLEDELGVSIVQRVQRSVGLTPEGQRVPEWAAHRSGTGGTAPKSLAGPQAPRGSTSARRDAYHPADLAISHQFAS